MTSTDASPGTHAETPRAHAAEMNLEVVTLPVSDVDRAKDFYQRLGWRLDADIVVGDSFRAVQFTPTRSPWPRVGRLSRPVFLSPTRSSRKTPKWGTRCP